MTWRWPKLDRRTAGPVAHRRGGQADRGDHAHAALLGGARAAPAERPRTSGERLYSPADLARVTRIRNLQELLGFSLAEVSAVLETGDVDVLDRVQSELRAGESPPARRRELLDEAIAANDQLLDRLDDTLSRIQAFRDERAEIAIRLRESRTALEENKSGRVAAGRR